MGVVERLTAAGRRMKDDRERAEQEAALRLRLEARPRLTQRAADMRRDCEDLYADAAARKEKLRRLRIEDAERARERRLFVASLKSQRLAPTEPDRLTGETARRRAAIDHLQAAAATQTSPTTTTTGRSLAARSSAWTKNRDLKVRHLAAERQQAELEKCTFQPGLTKRASRARTWIPRPSIVPLRKP